MPTSSSFVIRCGEPDCEWGCPMPDLSEEAFKSCYSKFAKHCLAVHGLTREGYEDAQMILDLEKWTLTLLK